MQCAFCTSDLLQTTTMKKTVVATRRPVAPPTMTSMRNPGVEELPEVPSSVQTQRHVQLDIKLPVVFHPNLSCM